MSKFVMEWARKTDVPLYYEMFDPVLTVDDGCFPSLEFTIEAKYGSTVPSVGNKDVYLVINGIEVNYLKLVSVDYLHSFNVGGLCRIRYQATINTCDPLHIDYLVEEFKERSKIAFTPPVGNGKTLAQGIAKAQNTADDMFTADDIIKLQESILKQSLKFKEEEMKIKYESTTIKSASTSSSMLGEMEKEYREKKRIEERDKAVEACDKKLRKEPGFDCFNAADYGVAYRHVTIERVKIDDPWVIMFWSDKTVTKAKCDELDSFDPEVGIMVCICKKLFRTPQNLRKILKNLTKDYYKEFEDDITFNGLKENLKESLRELSKLKEEADGSDNK